MLEQVSILNFRLRGVGRMTEAAHARAGGILNFRLSGVGRVSEAARARAGEHIKLQVEWYWKGVRSRPC